MNPSQRTQIAFIAERFGLDLVVLFGSHATERPKPGRDSDIDIAVHGCKPETFWECFNALGNILGHERLDLVRLEEADTLFRYEVMGEGKLLAGEPDLFHEYRAFAYRDFIDSADLFALEDALYRKKMSWLAKQLYDSTGIRTAQAPAHR